jgi:hypothetical protein
MDVRLPDGTVIKNVPDGMSKADLTAKLKANGYDVSKLEAPVAPPSEIPAARKERGFFETIGAPIEAASQGVISAGGNVMFGGQKLLGMGLEAAGGLFPEQQTLSGLVTGKRPLNAIQRAGSFLQEDAARRLAESQATAAPFKQEFPISTGAGELGGEILATYPIGGMIAAPLRAAIPAAAPLAQAIRSGGFSTGQVIQKGTPAAARVADLATRSAGGAITGGTTAAVINPADTETGVAIGAAIPLAGATASYLAKSAGFLKDAFTGQLAAVKAGKISRELAGDRIGAIRAALAAAPEDLTAAQAAAGVQNNAFQALGAFAGKTDDISLKLKQQASDDIALLQRMAEGGNETEARRAYEQSIQRLNQLTSDMRNVELGAANQAAKTINQLAPQAQQRQASMVNALREGMPANLPSGVAGTPAPGVSGIHAGTEALQRRNVADDAARRLMVARSQAARGMVSESGVPGVNDRQVARANKFVSEQWQEASDIFANIAKQRRAEAGFIENQIGSLEAHGLRPLDAGSITTAIDSKLAQPGLRASSNVTKVLESIRDDIVNLTEKGGGVIDAHDLYTLRKEGINERIMQILGQTDPKISAKVTRSVLQEVRPLIDDAIEKAGGTGWRDYLKTYSQGMQAIDQKAMAAQAAKLFDKSPQEYVRLVRGNNPDAVEAIFGPGSYDIFKEMGNKMPTLEKLAVGVEREKAMGEAALAGKEKFAATIEDIGRSFPHLPSMLRRDVTIGNVTFDELEKRLNKKVATKLQEGMLSGKSALEMLNTLPSAERAGVLRILTDPSRYGKTGAAAARAAVIPQTPTNTLAPKQENQNALAP